VPETLERMEGSKIQRDKGWSISRTDEKDKSRG
jgi:hypothetical protein